MNFKIEKLIHNSSFAGSEPWELYRFLPLIKDYQFFYLQRHMGDQKILAHFGEIICDSKKGFLLGCLDQNGQPVGFATVYFMPSSLSCSSYATMNDLFVSGDCRGKGVAKQLMKAVAIELDMHGYKSFDWMTQESNHTSQALYDSVTKLKQNWVYYSARVGDFL